MCTKGPCLGCILPSGVCFVLTCFSQICPSSQLCVCPVNSEHMSSLPSAVSDGSFPSPSMGLPSAAPSSSLGLPSAAAASSVPTTTSRVENNGSRSLPPHLGFTQSKDVSSASSAPLMVRNFMYELVYA